MITKQIKSDVMDLVLNEFRKAGRSAFRSREYAALAGRKGYARLALHRLKNKGELVLVKRGWWAFADALPDAIACEISAPAYLSFHSALYAHGLTTQIPRFVQLAVARNSKKYSVSNTDVKEYKVSRFTGFEKRDGVLLASAEKAFADCINVPRACSEIVLKEALPSIDTEQVRKACSGRALARLKKVIKNAGSERLE